jgi:polysaccharide biosynthesis protein VpsM
MLRKNLVLIRIAAVLSVVMFASFSLSFAVIRMSNLEIIPSIGLATQSDDNIYLQRNSAKSSMINSVSPGLNLYLPVENHQFGLNWRSDLIEYTENPSSNNTINNSVDLFMKFNFPVGLFLNLDNNWIATTDPLTTETIERTKRIQNKFSSEIGYRFADKYTVKAGYAQTLHDYLLEMFKQPLNRRESLGIIELAYNVSPKTAILADYGMGQIDYAFASNLNSSTFNQYMIGVRGQLTPKTIGEVKIGARDKKYNDLTGKDISLGVLDVSTLTNFTENTSLSIGANRSDVESTFVNNNYYIATSGSLSLKQKINKNWGMIVNGMYSIDGYPNASVGAEEREDQYVNAGLSLSYEAMKWLTISAGLTYKNRDSNFDIYDYVDNVIGLSAKLTY